MPVADRTFGSVLLQFAQSIDHVNRKTFERVGEQVIKYVEGQLDTDYFEFKELTKDDDGVEGLRKVWWSDRNQSPSGSARNRCHHFDTVGRETFN